MLVPCLIKNAMVAQFTFSEHHCFNTETLKEIVKANCAIIWFPRINDSFPRFTKLVLSDCNLLPRFIQLILSDCNSFPQFTQLVPYGLHCVNRGNELQSQRTSCVNQGNEFQSVLINRGRDVQIIITN